MKKIKKIIISYLLKEFKEKIKAQDFIEWEKSTKGILWNIKKEIERIWKEKNM